MLKLKNTLDYLSTLIKESIDNYITNIIDNDRYNHCGFEMLIGIPGCGKSTYLKTLNNRNIVVIAPDNIRKELTGDISDQSKNTEVWQIAEDMIIQNIFKGKYAILDATNVNIKYRQLILNAIKNIVGNGIKTYATVFNCNPSVSKQRISKDIKRGIDRANVPDEIIDIMYDQYLDTLKVIRNEGFDKVFFL